MTEDVLSVMFFKHDFAFISYFLQIIWKLAVLYGECMFICSVGCDMNELGVRNTEMPAPPV
jgi:hypothetical protein